jgi:xylan 1,4-beta-xylosidase
LNTVVSVNFSDKQDTHSYVPYWRKMVCAGRAAEGLREDWRNHLRMVQREIGFEYIRFHGILHDDMMIYHEDKNGDPYYNWQYLDELLDFLAEVNIRPCMELGFMPSVLASGDAVCFWWKGNITPPKDYKKWEQLVSALALHCVHRYGWEEVKTWFWEVWNEPNNPYFWSGTQEEYFKLYTHAARALKSLCPDFKVGGPATTNFSKGEAPWVKDLIHYCAAMNVPLDFVSTHPYPNQWPKDTQGVERMQYRDPDSAFTDLTWLRRTIDTSPFPQAEIHLTEWNSSASSRDLYHDTAFMAPFLLSNMVRCIGLVDSLGFWAFTDVFEENGSGDTMFHGGFGMITKQGLKKPAFHGFWFLARMGDEMILRGRDHFITKKKDGSLQILLWNYCHYKDEASLVENPFKSTDSKDPRYLDRYAGFDENDGMPFQVVINDLQGRYLQIDYDMDRENGSVFDTWESFGAIEALGVEEIHILKQRMEPAARFKEIECNHPYVFDGVIKPHGVRLIELKRRYD